MPYHEKKELCNFRLQKTKSMLTNTDFSKALSGSIIGGGISEFVALPICTVKTIFQTSEVKKYNRMQDVVSDVLRERGIKGFYYATLPAVLSQVASTSSKYTLYHLLKSYRQTKDTDFLNNAINGSMSGVCGGLLTQPIDVWKTHWQTNKSIINSIQQNGSHILYNGYQQSIIKNVGLYSMLFPLYDFYKSFFHLNSFAASCLTSLSTTTLLQPVEYYRVNKMAGNKIKFHFKNIPFYYKGFSLQLPINLTRFTISMFIIDFVKQM